MNQLNSQNGALVKISKFDYADIIQYNEPIYPGGETSFDINGKIRIEFAHLDNNRSETSDCKDASLMALDEIKLLKLIPENFKL